MKTLFLHMKKSGLFVIVVFILLIPIHSRGESKTFTMAFFNTPEKEPLLNYGVLLYTEAFRRLDLKFAYKVYPMKRCGDTANNGIVDGEPGRLAQYGKSWPNLIQVSEPVITQAVAAFAKNPFIELDGWDSLKGTGFKVEGIRGDIIVETNLAKVVPPKNLSFITRDDQGLRKIQAGRTDIFVHLRSIILEVLKAEEFKDSGIKEVGVLQEYSLYPFLHKKHKDLAPKLAAVLKQMKEEGLVEKYFKMATGSEN